FDAALRVRTVPSGEDGLVMRSFAQLGEVLVASPAYLDRHGVPAHPDELAGHATLSFQTDHDRQAWSLTNSEGATVRVDHTPRLRCHNFAVLQMSAFAGHGI